MAQRVTNTQLATALADMATQHRAACEAINERIDGLHKEMEPVIRAYRDATSARRVILWSAAFLASLGAGVAGWDVIKKHMGI